MAKQGSGLLKVQKKLGALNAKIGVLAKEVAGLNTMLEAEIKLAEKAAAANAQKAKAPAAKTPAKAAAKPAAKKAGRPAIAKAADGSAVADPLGNKARGRPVKK